MMKLLEYSGLDTTRVRAPYARVCEALARGDFRAAQVKKLVGPTGVAYYRARLNDADRLLFTLLRHGDETCVLVLEVIAHHAYDKSRFLRGAQIDEARIADADVDVDAATREAQPLRYLHPEHTTIHLLDKPLSFDDAQQAIYRRPPPLILVGSAGSGKTALTLEKLKHAEGEVLYVTHSAYLAQSARDLYYAHGFEHAGQDASFLSFREFVESIRVPAGREAGWRDFAAWFARMRQAFRDIDAHQAFEEIRGVIAARAGGVLSRASDCTTCSRNTAPGSPRPVSSTSAWWRGTRARSLRRATTSWWSTRCRTSPRRSSTWCWRRSRSPVTSCCAAIRTRSCIPTSSPGARSRACSGATPSWRSGRSWRC